MADLFTSAVANAGGNLATEYASPYLSYFFHYGKIVEYFKNQRKELESKKDRLKNEVEEAKRQTEVIHKDVEDWLTKVDQELEETKRLEDEIDRIKCYKWCPDWGWRYCLSKKLAKKTLVISKLLETCNFSRVGIRAPLQGIEFITSKDFMGSNSSKSAFNGILEALKAKGVNMIGLYGMPGVGKTTLAEEVWKHAEEEKLFNKVVMFTMSQTPNISKIQDTIADMLGFKFETNTEGGKAAELRRKLKGLEKILVIVDDLWEEFKLETIGIPFGVEHEGCKILLTTRLQQVCIKMGCQRILLNLLSRDEAWDLFKVNAGLDDSYSPLNDVAKEIAGECKGLPLAIVTVAKALKGESLDGWRAANQRLKESRHLDNEDVFGDVYRPLKLSYDYLTKNNSQTSENDIQSCFLLCSLFPEDYEIDIEMLIMCCIGLGLFSGTYSIEAKRTEIGLAIKKLQMSGLLLETYSAQKVKMHDVVRDFAHWLKSRGENKFMVKYEFKEWPNMVEGFGSYTAISLWNCSSIYNFPDTMDISKLKILFLVGNDMLRVSSTFFEKMEALQVLVLINVRFSLEDLPSRSNLQILYCKDCELEDLSSSLRNMRNLEILALLDTNIHEMPEELVELSALKSLYLSYEGEQEITFPPNLLSRLTSLQELHVTDDNNINLLELKSLSRLTALSLLDCSDECFQQNFRFPKLQRYNIVVALGTYLPYMQGLTFRTLNIGKLLPSLSAFKDLFCNMEKLRLENCSGEKNIVPSLCKKGANELTSLELASCKDIEFLIDITREKGLTVAFSNLGVLRIKRLASLKELCHGPPPTAFLQNLREVEIKDCPRLQVVFQMNTLLETVESRTQMPSNLTRLVLESLPELKSICNFEPYHRAIEGFQSLQYVRIEKCHKLKTIFSPCLDLSLLHLSDLYI